MSWTNFWDAQQKRQRQQQQRQLPKQRFCRYQANNIVSVCDSLDFRRHSFTLRTLHLGGALPTNDDSNNM